MPSCFKFARRSAACALSFEREFAQLGKIAPQPPGSVVGTFLIMRQAPHSRAEHRLQCTRAHTLVNENRGLRQTREGGKPFRPLTHRKPKSGIVNMPRADSTHDRSAPPTATGDQLSPADVYLAQPWGCQVCTRMGRASIVAMSQQQCSEPSHNTARAHQAPRSTHAPEQVQQRTLSGPRTRPRPASTVAAAAYNSGDAISPCAWHWHHASGM